MNFRIHIVDDFIGTNVEPTAQDPSNNFPELYTFSPVYIEWYFW